MYDIDKEKDTLLEKKMLYSNRLESFQKKLDGLSGFDAYSLYDVSDLVQKRRDKYTRKIAHYQGKIDAINQELEGLSLCNEFER